MTRRGKCEIPLPSAIPTDPARNAKTRSGHFTCPTPRVRGLAPPDKCVAFRRRGGAGGRTPRFESVVGHIYLRRGSRQARGRSNAATFPSEGPCLAHGAIAYRWSTGALVTKMSFPREAAIRNDFDMAWVSLQMLHAGYSIDKSIDRFSTHSAHGCWWVCRRLVAQGAPSASYAGFEDLCRRAS